MTLVASAIPLKASALWLAGCCLLLSAGCVQSKLEDPSQVVQVHGRVLYKGHPVAGAQLIFHREAEGESAFALTDAQGQFTGMTNDTNGIYPGEYQVTVTHPRATLPPKYAAAATSPLELTVFEGDHEQEFPIQLED